MKKTSVYVIVLGWQTGQVSRHVRNFNIAIFSDTINVASVKVSIMVLLNELYPIMSL